MLSSIEKESIRRSVESMSEEEVKEIVAAISSTVLMEEIYGRLELAELRLGAIRQAFDSKKTREIKIM